MKLVPVPYEMLNRVLAKTEALVAQGLKDTDTVTPEQAKQFLLRKEWEMLVVLNNDGVIDGIFLVSFTQEPNFKLCMITCAAGIGIVNKEISKQMDEFAISKGAIRLMALAKKSTARLYKQVGFIEKTAIMEKVI